MLEVAYITVAIALIVFIVYLIITLQKVGRVIDETENTVKNANFRCKCYSTSHKRTSCQGQCSC